MRIKPLLFAVALAISTKANAALIFSDSFDYADGALTTVSSPNWASFSGSTLPVQVSGGTISLTNLASGASGEDVRRALDSSYTTGVIYYSALITPTSAPTGLNGDYFLSGYSSAASGGGFFGRVFLSATTTGFTFGLGNGGAVPVDWTSDISLDTQYLVVVRLDIAARTATMGVFNPSSVPVSDSELTLSGGTASTTTGAIDYIALRQGSTAGAAFSNSIDRINVATTLAEVIPEPTTALLSALGCLAFLRRHR